MITFPFIYASFSFCSFLNKIVLSDVAWTADFPLQDPLQGLTLPHDCEDPFNCYFVSGYFFLDSYFNFDRSTAIFEPISALFKTNEMFDAKLLPFVN